MSFASRLITLGSAGAGGATGFYTILGVPPGQEMNFCDLVIASDDTIICGGNADNSKLFLASFNTAGALQNTRYYYPSSGHFRKDNGVGMDINSSDKISICFCDNTTSTRKGAGMVLNKDLTSYMSGNKFLTVGNRNWGSPDHNFFKSAIADNNVFYWGGVWTDGGQNQFGSMQYDAANSTQGHRTYTGYPSTPYSFAWISNTRVAMGINIDYPNSSGGFVVVIDSTDMVETGGANTDWGKSIDFDGGGNTKLYIKDIRYDGTYLYSVSDSYDGNNSDDIAIAKFTGSNGTLQWAMRYTISTGTNKIGGVQITIDSSGNIFFVAESAFNSTDAIIFGKINSSGTAQFAHKIVPTSPYNRTNVNNGTFKSGIACDSEGKVYIATTWNNTDPYGDGTTADFDRPVLMKLDPDGNTVGTFTGVTITAITISAISNTHTIVNSSQEIDVYNQYETPSQGTASTTTSVGGSYALTDL